MLSQQYITKYDLLKEFPHLSSRTIIFPREGRPITWMPLVYVTEECTGDSIFYILRKVEPDGRLSDKKYRIHIADLDLDPR